MEGRTFSHYQVIEKIGAGGMGVVYRGRDLELDRPVALKFLASDVCDSPSAHEGFRGEARTIASLGHANIATLYDLTICDGAPVLVMEYLPGGALRSRISVGALPLDEVLSYAAQLAEGLAHAHGRGVVHRDVKPENMLFAADGRLKLTDFGLARARDGRTVTVDERIAGTLRYLPPEIVRGQASDHRSDIFSLGVVVFEMAAGRHPFGNEPPARVLYRIAHTGIPPLATLRPELPLALDRVVRRATARDRGMRYQSAEQMLRDLRDLEPSLREAAHPPSEAPTILVIEDDDSLRGVLGHGLSDNGYRVVKAGDGREGLRLASEERPDLILLDVGLPGRNGLDVCRDLRCNGFEAPILMVTGKVEEIDRVLGLETGADDYVTKPFSQRELVARIRAHLRRRIA